MLREGLQTELLLLIADYQPLPRQQLRELFSGDDRQTSNTSYVLRAKGLVKSSTEGTVLTVAGEEMAKQVSATHAEKLKSKKSPPKAVPPMLLRSPSPAKAGDYQAKVNLLQDLARPMAPEFAAVLASIERDVMTAHGFADSRNCVNT